MPAGVTADMAGVGVGGPLGQWGGWWEGGRGGSGPAASGLVAKGGQDGQLYPGHGVGLGVGRGLGDFRAPLTQVFPG